jgi:hypothetical protein
MDTTTESADTESAGRRRFGALSTIVAIIAGTVAVGLPLSTVAASGGDRSVTITT